MRLLGAIVVVICVAEPRSDLISAAHAQPAPEPAPAPPSDGPAPGDSTSPDPKLARRWTQAGQQLVQQADALTRRNQLDGAREIYENAATAFGNAIEAGDDPGGYTALAQVEEKLGRFDDAVRHYRRVAHGDGVRPEAQQKATAKLQELAAQVGFITLVVTPAAAVVMLDDRELGRTPMAEPLVLLPGRYRLWLKADGYASKTVEVPVEAGSEIERSITLDPVSVGVAPPTITASGPAQPVTRSRLPLYVGGGVALTAASVAVVTGILAIGQHRTYVAIDSTPSERADARSSGRRLAFVADLSLGAALVAGGITAYWYFVTYRRGSAEGPAGQPAKLTNRPKVELAPWVQLGGGGISLVGSL